MNRIHDPAPPTTSAHVTDEELFARRDEPESRRRIVERYRGLAYSIAERFVRSGTERDDARQVAALALVKAIDRFDVDRGVQFSTYASRTISGELKRARRDRSWDIHVPRSLQERWLSVARAREHLTQELSRPPATAEIAGRLGLSVGEVDEALEAGNSHTIGSLDRTLSPEPGRGTTVGDRLGERDPVLKRTPDRMDVAEAIEELDERDQLILYLRFFEGMTQSEIGEEVGVSQMHVSRLLRHALDLLQDEIEGLGEDASG